MRNLYVLIRNMLLFFFLVVVFSGPLLIRNGTFLDKLLVGLLFGLFMMLIPNVLKFFKLPVNNGSLLLMGVIVAFLFFFVALYNPFLPLITVVGGNVDLGLGFIQPIKLQDKTVALVFLSLVSAVISIGLEILSKKK